MPAEQLPGLLVFRVQTKVQDFNTFYASRAFDPGMTCLVSSPVPWNFVVVNMNGRTMKLHMIPVCTLAWLTLSISVIAQEGWVATRIGTGGADLNTVFFLDSKRGWVGGDSGYLSRTDDGGLTWVRQVVGTTAAINDIYFRDKDAGFLLAGNTIFVTRDSGTRWSEARRFLPGEFDGASVELYTVRFSSKKKGWVVGSVSRRDRVIDSILVFTDDGGDTWQRTILFTRDGGQNWTRQNSGTTATIFHIDFRDEKKGWAVGEKGTVLRTVDGGENWTPVVTNVRATILSVQFLNDDDGWTVGRGGMILRSADTGRTWVQQEATTKQNLYALYFNKKVGWAVGGDGTILRYER